VPFQPVACLYGQMKRNDPPAVNNNVIPFPKRACADEIPSDEPLVIFSLGEQRFAIQCTVAVKGKPAEVIPIQKRRKGPILKVRLD
jgi:hypothetical protein